MSPRDLQRPDDRKRHDNDDDIGDDVEDRSGQQECRGIDATATYLLVPRVLNRRTLKDVNETKSDAVSDGERSDREGDGFETIGVEDSSIEEKDRDLDDGDTDDINEDEYKLGLNDLVLDIKGHSSWSVREGRM